MDYIKILKKEKDKKSCMEEEMKKMKMQNRKLLLKLQVFEES